MPFDGMDAGLISTFGSVAEGRTVLFEPAGSSDDESVDVIIQDANALSGNGALLVLFGTIEASGFSRAPAKNDHFTVDGETYRVFEVRKEQANSGIHISLTK